MSAATEKQFAYHIGRKVGRYNLLELLGSGGTAEVYRSVHPDLKRDVAVKVLFPSHTQDIGFVRRFRQEAQTAAALVHPHIVQIYDFEVTPDGLYIIVMQYVNGPSLSEFLNGRETPLSLVKSYTIFQQIAGALQFAHEAKTIHRDLKPANVLLDGRDHVYLSDFGFAKLVGVDMQTRSSITLGTPVFMAPEQIESGPVTPATDVYALGAILYQMLTNQLPYKEDNVLAMILRKIEEPPLSPRILNRAIPIEVEKLIYKAMAIRPEDRFQSVAQMAATFSQALDNEPGMSLPQAQAILEPMTAVPPPSGFSRKWASLFAIGFILLLLGIFFLGGDNNNNFIPAPATETAVTLEMSGSTAVPSQTPTRTASPLPATAVATETATRTPSQTPTQTKTATPTNTATASATATLTPSNTAVPTLIPSSTPPPTATAVPPTAIPPTPPPSQPTSPPPAPTQPPVPTQPPEPPTRTPPAPPTQTPSP